MALHVVLGKGAVGTHTARELREQGHHVRIVSRSGARPGAPADGFEHVAADAGDAARLTALSEGAVALYNCANPAYDRWAVEWPPIQAALLAAAESTGATLVVTGNLYPYGPVDRPMTEDLPDAATDRKGRIRAGMWAEAKALHDAGRIRAVEARAADFYGPDVVSTGHLAELVVPRMLQGKAVQIVGSADTRHSFTYIPDLARALARLAQEPVSWGRTWHVPTAPALTRREAVVQLSGAAGVAVPRIQSLPWWAVRAIGFAQPQMREMHELRYQWQGDYVLDSSDYERTFGQEATPLEEGFERTVAWWRGREAVPR